ncbi:MAG: hypothetical protein V2A67_11640 [Bacteroidota bacterium]
MKKLFPSCLIALASFLAPSILSGQDFGSFPPDIHWNQINTKKIRVIFPNGLESQARQVSNLILFEDANNRTSIGPLTKKYDLILNNQGVISNGYVTIMPFRSEYFTTPPQDGNSLGTLDWLNLLSIHEYRHALQYMNLRKGLIKIAYVLSGESGWGVGMNLAVPAWFFEGDAVSTETAITNQGRGRIPDFMSQYPSILLDNRKYTYMKARNGSFRDYVPDHYTLGYLLCSYARDSFGNDVWDKVLKRTSWYRGIIYPFSKALKKNTGLSTRKLYKKAFADYKEQWHQEDSLLVLSPYVALTKPSKTVTSYRYPVYLANGDLLVHKSSYNKTGAIYKVLPDSSEVQLCETGIAQDLYFTAGGSWIAWAEVTWDERYSAQNYSDVVLFNTETGTKRYLTRHQRYFSPAVSPDGSKLLVMETDLTNQYRVKILDINTGEVLQTLPNPENLYYTFPKWDTDGKSIISSVRKSTGNMLIIKQSINDGTSTTMTREINQIIGEVVVTPKNLIYSSSYSGINNIYSFNRSSSSTNQLTSTRFGAYYPAVTPDGKTLAYSEFTRKGYQLVAAPMTKLLNKSIHPVPLDKLSKFDRSFYKAEGGNILSKIPDQEFTIKPYKTWQHPGKIHSWTLSPTTESIGLYLISDNTLSNLHVEAGVDYYWNEQVPGFNASIQYAGLYPVMGLGFSRNYRSTSTDIDGIAFKQFFVDNIGNAEVSVPLNFSKGMFYRQVLLSAGYNLITNQEIRESDYWPISEATIIHSVSASAKYVQTKRQAYQNITTPLGFGLELSANQSIGIARASQYMAIADGAIRGFLPNHNLVVTGAWKLEYDNNEYSYLDLFVYPRGFSIPRSNWMVSVQASYHLPLLYPDFGFAGIFYCSRVRADVFGDYAYADIPYGAVTTSNGLFLSTGAELILDTKWLNLVDLPIGFRFSVLLTNDYADPTRRFNYELVFPVIRL